MQKNKHNKKVKVELSEMEIYHLLSGLDYLEHCAPRSDRPKEEEEKELDRLQQKLERALSEF